MNDADFSQLIRKLASQPDNRPLPDPGAIWAKAALRKRLETSRKAEMALHRAEGAALVISAGSAVLLFHSGIASMLDPTVARFCGAAVAGTAAIMVALLGWLWVEE